jgi:hypothetical protein
VAPAVVVCELPTTADFSKPAMSTLDPAYYSLSRPALKGLAMMVGTTEPALSQATATTSSVHAPFANVPLPRLARVAM